MRNQEKRREEKRRQPSKTLSFFFILSLCPKQKGPQNSGALFQIYLLIFLDERKKEKEGRGFGRLPSLLFPPFFLVSHNRLF